MCKKQGGTLPYALLILLQSVLYGFGNPLSKIGFESITVLWCLGIRFSGAAALMLLLFGRRTGSGGGADLRRCGGAAAGDRHRLAGGGVSGAAVYVPVLRAAKYGPDPAVLLHRVAAAMHPAHPDSGMLLPAAGGEAVGDRTGGSGAYRGLRGAGKLAERPKANRIRIRGRSFLNVLLFSYKETFAVEIGRFLTIVMCDAG